MALATSMNQCKSYAKNHGPDLGRKVPQLAEIAEHGWSLWRMCSCWKKTSWPTNALLFHLATGGRSCSWAVFWCLTISDPCNRTQFWRPQGLRYHYKMPQTMTTGCRSWNMWKLEQSKRFKIRSVCIHHTFIPCKEKKLAKAKARIKDSKLLNPKKYQSKIAGFKPDVARFCSLVFSGFNHGLGRLPWLKKHLFSPFFPG